MTVLGTVYTLPDGRVVVYCNVCRKATALEREAARVCRQCGEEVEHDPSYRLVTRRRRSQKKAKPGQQDKEITS